jgi:flavin reductase (DIM6/NTAB) family NADH-FMN oxidoreductase RutF
VEKIDVPVNIPDCVSFPEYRDKYQLRRWVWRHIQIPYPMYIITTNDENGVPNAEVNTWGLPFGFMPDQMFIFVCSKDHHTAQYVLRSREFVVNVPGSNIGQEAEKTATSYPKGTDEIKQSGLTGIPSKIVKPPRIKECKAHFECKLEWFRYVDKEGKAIVFCGRIVAASANKEVLTGNVESKTKLMKTIYVMPWNIDTVKMKLTGKEKGTTAYANVGKIRYTAYEE